MPRILRHHDVLMICATALETGLIAQTSLAPGQQAILEAKILIVKASLDQVLTTVKQQRNTLR